ncbi:MAG: septal ring lytic transglycosylase RlpA family protein [Abditibacteriaceae bacterium]
MQKLKSYLSVVTLLVSLCVVSSFAFARDGKAAYCMHTSKMVTASRYEPIGSTLLVTNPETSKSVKVTVIDRGPFNGNRILDLSTGAFKALFGSLGRGVGNISYKVLQREK